MLHIHNLLIETTRRCNMNCAHCMRGEPQKKLKMCREHLYNFLSKVDSIGCVTFTGGEPSLPSGMDSIELFLEFAYMFNIEVYSFFIVTNGKRITERFTELIRKLYWLCEDNEISGVMVSSDNYHDTKNHLPEKLYNLETELNMPVAFKEVYSVIQEGRAKDWGAQPNRIDALFYRKFDEQIDLTKGQIYLNCKGNVINGCDWSYESQDDPKNIICAAEQFSEDFIRENVQTEEEFNESMGY